MKIVKDVNSNQPFVNYPKERLPYIEITVNFNVRQDPRTEITIEL